VALGAMWLFGKRVENAFEDAWIWPALGLVVFPWATIMYIVLWTSDQGVLSGEWGLVAVAALADVISWFFRVPKRRHRYP